MQNLGRGEGKLTVLWGIREKPIKYMGSSGNYSCCVTSYDPAHD